MCPAAMGHLWVPDMGRLGGTEPQPAPIQAHLCHIPAMVQLQALRHQKWSNSLSGANLCPLVGDRAMLHLLSLCVPGADHCPQTKKGF